MSSRWIKEVFPSHWVRATHLAPNGRRDFPLDEGFPLVLVFNGSGLRQDELWDCGVSHGMAYAQVFRCGNRVRLAQSLSGIGRGNPAWDFQSSFRTTRSTAETRWLCGRCTFRTSRLGRSAR
ncbi:hypothetical protein EP7_001862 [Isosphaeraceae bacterium EP7]